MHTVFWDFDGTLVYSDSLWSKSALKALLEADSSTNVTWEQLRPLLWGTYTWDTPDEDHSRLIDDLWWERMLYHIHHAYRVCGVPDDIAIRAVNAFKSVLMRKENYRLYPDTIDVLTRVKCNGMRNVLLSNNFPELGTIVSLLGLDPLFEGLIISAKEGYDKPRTELFDIAKTRYPSERYYMIGDNPYADVFGGNNADMTTILVHHPAVPEANHCFASLTDILSVLK